jgi:nucleoid-associated protein YgaU
VRRPCAQALVAGSLLAALSVVPAMPGAAAAEPAGNRQELAQAQGPKTDATAEETDAERPPPLRWLRHSSDRFRILMRMLAERSARTQAQRAADAKAAEEQAQRAAEVKAAEEQARRTAEAKAAEEQARRAAEAKAAEEQARRAAEAKAAEEQARHTAEAKAAEEQARRTAEAKTAEEEARRVAQAKAAEEAKQAAEGPTLEKPAEAARPAPAVETDGREPCANAGVKVAGAGWYVIRRGDSLWSIARVHYGHGRTYRRIHTANRRRIANPARIYPCQRIYIPRASAGDAPLQALRVALEPFIRRRAIDTGLPGFVD